MSNRNFKLLIVGFWVALLAHLALGQSICSTAIKATWEPRNLVTKAGLVAGYDPGNASDVTLAGSGVSVLRDRARSIRTGNLLLQSETFATTWTRSKMNGFTNTVDVNERASGSGSFANSAEYADPLGGNTADFVQEDGSATSNHYITQTVAAPTGSYIFYCWARPAGRSWFHLQVSDGSAHVGRGYFDVQNGVAGSTMTILGSPTGMTTAIVGSSGSWYLCKFTITLPTPVQSVYISPALADNGTTYNGDNTSGLLIWGASLVASDWTQVTGPTLAQGYQVTTTAPYAPPNIIQPTAAAQPLISRTDMAGNLCKQSEDFSTTWSRTRLNTFAGSTDATNTAGSGSFINTARVSDPLGGNTADFLQEDATATATHQIAQSGISVPAGTYSLYFWFMQGPRAWVQGQMAIGSDTASCYFDAGTKAVGTAANGGGATGASGSVVSGTAMSWCCFKLTGVFPTSGSMAVTLRLATADLGNSYNGDNTSGGFIWGGVVIPSSWTPVTGTTAALGYVTTTTQPIFPGLAGRSVMYFDGANHYLKSGYGSTFTAFPLVQPEEVYLGVMQWTWTDSDQFTDGFGIDSGMIYQRTTTPTLKVYAGSGTPPASTSLALGAWGLVLAKFDGASTYIKVNNDAAIVGGTGANAMGGFTLGGRANAFSFANGLISRALVCNRTNSPAESSYLAWGIKKQAGVQ